MVRSSQMVWVQFEGLEDLRIELGIMLNRRGPLRDNRALLTHKWEIGGAPLGPPWGSLGPYGRNLAPNLGWGRWVNLWSGFWTL